VGGSSTGVGAASGCGAHPVSREAGFGAVLPGGEGEEIAELFGEARQGQVFTIGVGLAGIDLLLFSGLPVNGEFLDAGAELQALVAPVQVGRDGGPPVLVEALGADAVDEFHSECRSRLGKLAPRASSVSSKKAPG